MAVWLVLAAIVALVAYVRLAPEDPARWHVDLTAGGLPDHAHIFCIRPDNRFGPIQGDPVELLARLDGIGTSSTGPLRQRSCTSAAALPRARSANNGTRPRP